MGGVCFPPPDQRRTSPALNPGSLRPALTYAGCSQCSRRSPLSRAWPRDGFPSLDAPAHARALPYEVTELRVLSKAIEVGARSGMLAEHAVKGDRLLQVA